MLGSVSEAEDAVHEGFLRPHRARERIGSPRAYLSTVVSRLSLDHRTSCWCSGGGHRARPSRRWGAPPASVTIETDDTDLLDS
jgi:DNA-directed RNA polymerase specialized sigma24 family protein